MARIDNLTNFLTDVAGAIKTKKGDNTAILASNFDTEITNLPSGGDLSDYYVSGANLGGTSSAPGILKALKKIPALTISGSSFAYAFSGCTNLEEVALIDTSNISSFQRTFYNCEKLKSLPLFNTGNVTAFTYAFYHCYALETIPLFNTQNVTNMQNAFQGCTKITEVPQLNTVKVANFANCFNGCSILRNVPILDTTATTTMAAMFANCGQLTNQSIDNIMKMCINATNYTDTKKLSSLITISYYNTSTIQGLSNYNDFITAGWTLS